MTRTMLTMVLAWHAYRSVASVSSRWELQGLTVANIVVLELPPRLSCNKVFRK